MMNKIVNIIVIIIVEPFPKFMNLFVEFSNADTSGWILPEWKAGRV